MPETKGVCSGQVLHSPYPFDKARLIVREMAEAVAMDLLEKGLVTDLLTLTVGYDIENVASGAYRGEVTRDVYGRAVPKHAHGTARLPAKTSSARGIVNALLALYDEKVEPSLTIRRITVTADRLVREDMVKAASTPLKQLSLFEDAAAQEAKEQAERDRQHRERKIQEAMLGIKQKYGGNAILSGASYLDGATGRERGEQIGGHRK